MQPPIEVVITPSGDVQVLIDPAGDPPRRTVFLYWQEAKALREALDVIVDGERRIKHVDVAVPIT